VNVTGRSDTEAAPGLTTDRSIRPLGSLRDSAHAATQRQDDILDVLDKVRIKCDGPTDVRPSNGYLPNARRDTVVRTALGLGHPAKHQGSFCPTYEFQGSFLLLLGVRWTNDDLDAPPSNRRTPCI